MGRNTNHFLHYRLGLRGLCVFVIAALAAALTSSRLDAAEGEWEPYLWETARTVKVSPAASGMIQELRAEVQKLLDAGPLAPLRAVYADLVQDEYFLYWQPGRIITTLARAYPYLTPAQQQAAKRYVRAELDDPARCPWAAVGYIPADQGARREIHSFNQGYGWDRYWQMWGHRKPAMGAFYGLWLYADRTGDWAALKRHYPAIADLYLRKAGQCDLYGTMGAHLAMARIAEHFHDTRQCAAAIENARAAFQAGLSFAGVEERARHYWPERYEPREQGLVYQGWMFLDLAPEIGRYLADHVRGPVLERHRQGVTQYPLFWLREVPYWSRWTGDEGLGIPTELMGMLVPVERWVAGASPESLAHCTRSAPICTGDCYWLEMLVDAIEATGTTSWVEVRTARSAGPAYHAASFLPARAPAPVTDPVLPREFLALRSVGRSGRTPLHRDPVEARIVAGNWSAPRAGETVALTDGASAAWTAVTAPPVPEGWTSVPAPPGGYLWASVEATAPRVMLLEATGHSMVYVDGEPRVGDPYETGWVRLPIRLRAGANGLLFQCARRPVRMRLIAPRASALLDARDATLPDRVVGESAPVLGAVVIINATTRPRTDLALRAVAAGARPTVTALPEIPPLSTRKVAFRWAGAAPAAPGSTELELSLVETKGSRSRQLDSAKIVLRVRRPAETQKRTFVSDIDGSVQYYALNPAPPASSGAPALFLSLHGAGVEAIGQADAYESKTWGDIVAPTNRRPYGFDWEDWGRLDALEVLALARRQLHTDPQRTYLTGHSMGGHGAWQLGVTFPDQFAAVGPSAGWISFTSYAGAPRVENPTPMEQMLQRAALPSDTLALSHNLTQEGVCILHGGADDNVPVTQARTMRDTLSGFHHDFVYFEQPGAGHWWDVSDEPGADCVDWAPMFDFFAHHRIPEDESLRQIDFATADPGVSARSHWAGIEAQIHPLQLSSVSLRCDPGRRRFAGTTSNVARLSLRLSPLRGPESFQVELDGQTLSGISVPADRQLWLAREGGTWRVVPPPSPALKSPERCGPFKQAFRHRMLFVYGTRGTPEENAWALAKARYDAETFWYRGNGAVDVVADTRFNGVRDRDRSVIMYGNAETNAAWGALLAGSPVVVRRGSVQIGSRTFAGSDLACLFVRPRPGSAQAEVGVVGGTGPAGMRLTDRLPYFLSGVEYPDLLVLGPETLAVGSQGVRAAGFFGPDWGVESGEFAWQGSGG